MEEAGFGLGLGWALLEEELSLYGNGELWGRGLQALWATVSKSSPRFPRSLLNVGIHWLVGTLVPFHVYVLDGYFYFWVINSLLCENYVFEEAHVRLRSEQEGSSGLTQLSSWAAISALHGIRYRKLPPRPDRSRPLWVPDSRSPWSAQQYLLFRLLSASNFISYFSGEGMQFLSWIQFLICIQMPEKLFSLPPSWVHLFVLITRPAHRFFSLCHLQ